MSDIQYMEKPDWVSWDDIRICLNAAHKTNKKSGFEMRNSTITTEELQEVMKDAHCFVALDGAKVVGVMCVRIVNRKKWYVRGPVIYYFGDGILPASACSKPSANNGDSGNIQKNEKVVDAHCEEWRCACFGSHGYAEKRGVGFYQPASGMGGRGPKENHGATRAAQRLF